MSRLAAELPLQAIGEVGKMLSRREKTLLIAGAIIACSAIWLLSVVLDVPTYPGFSASLLQQPSGFAAVTMMAVAFVASTLIGSILARSVRYDAGLWCAAIALVALSARGGPVRFVLMSAHSSRVYLQLALEIVVLGLFFELGGVVIRGLANFGMIRPEPEYDGLDPARQPLHRKFLATLTGVVVAGLIILILCQSDRKLQVTLVVWFASLVGAATAYYLVPAGPVRWFISIPLACGLIGYLATYFNDPSGWVIGEPRGFFQALARPLPLDYAGAGGAGAITGYWLGQWWQLKREVEAYQEKHGENNEPDRPPQKA